MVEREPNSGSITSKYPHKPQIRSYICRKVLAARTNHWSVSHLGALALHSCRTDIRTGKTPLNPPPKIWIATKPCNRAFAQNGWLWRVSLVVAFTAYSCRRQPSPLKHSHASCGITAYITHNIDRFACVLFAEFAENIPLKQSGKISKYKQSTSVGSLCIAKFL